MAITTRSSTKCQREESPSLDIASTLADAVANEAKYCGVMPAFQAAYSHMLAGNAKGMTFLFGKRFSKALQKPADVVATKYDITKDRAIEEFRRFIAIKTFTVDHDATKISPTPISTYQVLPRDVIYLHTNPHLIGDELWHAAVLDTVLCQLARRDEDDDPSPPIRGRCERVC